MKVKKKPERIHWKWQILQKKWRIIEQESIRKESNQENIADLENKEYLENKITSLEFFNEGDRLADNHSTRRKTGYLYDGSQVGLKNIYIRYLFLKKLNLEELLENLIT